MNNPTYHSVHNRFKLNGFHLDKDDLCRVAYSFIKEGEAFERPVGIFILDWFDEKEYIEMTTSGTTGAPKKIKVNKQAMVNSALATGDFFDLAPGNKVLHCLPAQYVAGKMMFVRAFILGLDLDFVEPTSTPLERNDETYDFAAMVPLQAQHSLAQLGQIKKLIIGGAKVSSALANELQQVSSAIFETYGMTETITHIAAKRVGEEAFQVLPGITVAEDERHCLVVTAPTITDEAVVTNDVVKVLNENEFIWLGRIDNVINSGGVKLFPEQIEEKLSHKIERRFFIASQENEELGEKLVLAVEGDPFVIDDAAFGELGKYEKPKVVLFIPKFLETPTGKVLRKESLSSV
ncbi:O-succinylbenzoic acid--CoA ligase [Flavobacterium gossypii]|uniref:O-succinylbenzoic acid--CoA ligase n=2 Tax=Flavobacterium TaxID=237 RepID=A0A495M4V5_9FLAO|nr:MULTISPECIES: AMP-binding protein [Flavobacterium]MBA9074918.1 O-succinylbenzoic acid--CoA ligase [Flavobacterium gossypii]RKS20498.1 O-succinylbenzoic acid--CoA ligase [Flavobacterium endophyticum]